MTSTTDADAAPSAPLARTLRRLSAARFVFALVWAALLVLLAGEGAPLLTALVVLYPLVDAVAVFVELRSTGSSSRSRITEALNVVLSLAAAVALGWASFVSPAAVLTVWGIWATASGVTQLLTGLSRRRLGGQWALIVSGGLSVLVGFAFAAQGLQGGTSVIGAAGYAVLGGIFFLVSAIRLGRAARAS